MGNSKLADQRKYMVQSPTMATSSLRTKVHKDGCPGRLVVNQIDVPTYKMSKVLTDILNPLDERAESFLKFSKQLKDELELLEIEENHVMAFDRCTQ